MSAYITNLYEDPNEVQQISAWVGDWHAYTVRLTDANGSPIDITTGTLAITYTNNATGVAYSFVSGTATLTKSFSTQGIITVLNPNAYPTAAVIRTTISFTVSTTVRRFGPLLIEVLSP
jgi:lipoprotein signal peptidase